MTTTRPHLKAMLIGLAAATFVVTGCGSSSTDTSASTTTQKLLETLPTTTTTGKPPPTEKPAPTTTTTAAVTTTLAKVNGKFAVTPSSTPNGWTFPDTSGASPQLTWDVKLEPGQKLSVHGPAPGVADVELSTVAAGSYPLCPGTYGLGACEVTESRYVWTLDVINADGSIAATQAATLRVQ